MAGYIGSKAVVLSTTGSEINGDSSVTGSLTVGGAFTSKGIDDNAAATTMTLNASGHVLVGTTESDPASANVAGTRLSVINSQFSAASNTPVYINRITTDGTLVDLRKNGTTVGAIGVLTGALTVGGAGTNAGLYYGTQGLLPTQGGALSDNTKDLGSAAYRFNEAYIGGGVYLGGTGAANLLDDYEEGNWNPVIATGGLGTGAVTHATYTKIGDIVTVRAFFTTTGVGSTATLTVGGLTFTSVTEGYAVGGFDVGKGGIKGMYCRSASNQNVIEFLYPSENIAADRLLLKGNQVGAGYFIITLAYKTA
jgi:hypothetical protein